jgi:hypothetical protein
MINVKDIEEGVMIEVNEFNYPLSNLVNDVTIAGKDLSRSEVYKYASNIAASLFMEGFIKLQKSSYKQTGDDSYELISSRDLTAEEIDYIVKGSEKWDEDTIMSEDDVFELSVTEKGRSYFNRD